MSKTLYLFIALLFFGISCQEKSRSTKNRGETEPHETKNKLEVTQINPDSVEKNQQNIASLSIDSVQNSAPTETLKFEPNDFDALSRFIAGLPQRKGSGFEYLDTLTVWKTHAAKLDSFWQNLEIKRHAKMRSWQQEEMAKHNKKSTTLFYPFSGPDFIHGDIFFPEVTKYVLIGLESPGDLPLLQSKNIQSIKSYFDDIKKSLDDLIRKSYFITNEMSSELSKENVNGVTPLLCFFISRSNYAILNIEKIYIDTIGNPIVTKEHNIHIKNRGIKITFVRNGDKIAKTLYYIKTDLSDGGLARNAGIISFCKALQPAHVLLKAASYLMHYKSFSTIRDLVLEVGTTLLQDDSGISYKYFDNKIWNIKLYGGYENAAKGFKGVNQPDLKKAYKVDTTTRRLPFYFGYQWGTRGVNLLYGKKL